MTNKDKQHTDAEIKALVMEAFLEAEQEIRLATSTTASVCLGITERVMPRVNKDDGTKLGRNDPCPCKSGKKYKNCCWELLNR